MAVRKGKHANAFYYYHRLYKRNSREYEGLSLMCGTYFGRLFFADIIIDMPVRWNDIIDDWDVYHLPVDIGECSRVHKAFTRKFNHKHTPYSHTVDCLLN